MESEKVKVIHVITRLDKGGSAENTFLTVKGLDKEKYDVILIKGLSFESNMTENELRAIEEELTGAEREGIKIITIPVLVRSIHPFYDLKVLFNLIRILRRERPNIVHTHTSKAGILGRWAAFFAGVPVIIHTPHGHIFWGYFGRLKTRLFILLEIISALVTDRLIMLTEQEKKDHLRACIASEEKFTVVHSGVDLDCFKNVYIDPLEMKRKLGIPEDALVVGTTGRLTPVKGQRYLIEAAGKIVDKRLDTIFVFLGDGKLLGELKNMTFRLGIEENVRFPGWRQDVAEVMSIFDIFLLPSLNEGLGRVLVEAMALGKPLVASNVGGIPDLVVDGKNGFLVPVGDVETMAIRINDLLESAEKREKMGNTGRRYAAKYGSEEMTAKIDLLYRRLMRQKDIAV